METKKATSPTSITTISMTFRRISEEQWIETDESVISRFWQGNKAVRDAKLDPRVWVDIQQIDRSYNYIYDADIAKAVRFTVHYVRECDGCEVITAYTYNFVDRKNTQGWTRLITPEGVHMSPSPAKEHPGIKLEPLEFPYVAVPLAKEWPVVLKETRARMC